MVVIVDIDCTLYSYAEFIKSQNIDPFLFYKALTDINSQEVFDAVDRTWENYNEDIVHRMKFLIEKFKKKRVFFYSSFPLSNAKKNTFQKLKLTARSSYPQSKVEFNHLLKIPKPASLIIGDRKEDEYLGKILNAEWIGFKFYNQQQWTSGQQYTYAFKKLINDTVKRSI